MVLAVVIAPFIAICAACVATVTVSPARMGVGNAGQVRKEGYGDDNGDEFFRIKFIRRVKIYNLNKIMSMFVRHPN